MAHHDDNSPRAAGGDDRLTAIPRGPRSVFVHWNLEGPLSGAARAEVSVPVQWVLRVLDISDGTSETLAVEPNEGSRYVEVLPGRVYGFELAVRAAGRWRTICRTGRLSVPPAGRAAAGRPAQPEPDRERRAAEARGLGVPGLTIESTPLRTGSSPIGRGAATE